MELSDRDIRLLDTQIKSLLCLLPQLDYGKLTGDDAAAALDALNVYLAKITLRDDVINAELFRGLLETSSSQLPPLRVTSEVQCGAFYDATTLIRLDKAVAVGLEDTNPVSIWDFIMKPSRGAVGYIQLERDCLRPVVVFNHREPVTAGAALGPQEAALGLADGSIAIARFHLEDDWKCSLTAPLLVHSGRIVSMGFHAEVGLLASISSDNTLRVLQYEGQTLTVVAGGSLKSRLTTATLTTLAMDPSGQKLFLGTSINRVLIYTLDNFQPKYLTSISTRASGPIRTLVTDSHNILICDGPELLVWSNVKSPALVDST